MDLLGVAVLTSFLERWNWAVVSISELPLSHHRFISLWLDTPLQTFLYTSLSGAPQNCFQSGPALAKASNAYNHGFRYQVNCCGLCRSAELLAIRMVLLFAMQEVFGNVDAVDPGDIQDPATRGQVAKNHNGCVDLLRGLLVAVLYGSPSKQLRIDQRHSLWNK